MKSLITSKTFQLAVIQAIASVIVVALTDLDMVGYVGIVKSLADILLRMVTDKPIGSVV